MKKFDSILIYAAFAAFAGGLAACDNIADDDRLIPVPEPEVKRNVLIQEFTGVRCPNCPQGAAAVHSILDYYAKGSVVAVSLHPSGSPFTRPLNGLNLTSAPATAYFNHYHPSAFPSAIIDGAAPDANTAAWDGMVYAELEKTTPMDISASTSFDASDRKLTVEYDVRFKEIMTSAANINVWLTESGIIGPQLNNTQTVPDYEHNHVLRASLTGDWGESLGESFLYGEELNGKTEIVLEDAWVADNCSVVIFAQNPSSKYVYQVIEISLKADDENK